MYDPTLPHSRVFLPAIVSGLLLYSCYFPLNLGFLAWVALVPFLFLVRANARPRRIYFAAFVGGLTCYGPAIQWIRVADPAMYASWFVLALYCSLSLVVILWLTRKLDRTGVPVWLGFPVACVSVEYFRSHFPTGFSWLEMFGQRHPIGFGWYMLGHTQHDSATLIQVADLTGAYGLTFLVAMLNAVLWLALERNALVRVKLRQLREPPPASFRPTLVAAVLLVTAVVYGYVRLDHEPFAEGPRVALIQGNIAQDMKNEKGREMLDHFSALANDAAHPDGGSQGPDLIVWPETAYVYRWYDVDAGAKVTDLPDLTQQVEFLRDYNLSRLAIREDMYGWKVHTLLGLNAVRLEADGQKWKYNTALLVGPDGKAGESYDKIHLVPWGEYVPAEKTLPFLKNFTPYEGDYSCRPGERWTRFPLPVRDQTYHFACLICYEDTDATLARTYVRPGAEGIDFFVNISNDGWFDGTEEHEQHLAICRFRAVETRRSIARAVNMGISAIIDPDGRVIAKPGNTWSESKKVDAIVRGSVPIDTRTTLYARVGDWLPILAWMIVLGGFVRGFVRRRPAAA